MTHANAINDAGDIVGQYLDTASLWHGFLLSGDKFTSIDFPGAKQTFPMGINSRGDIAGYYGLDGVQHGFLLSKGKFTALNCPGEGVTFIYGINAAGDMAGYFAPPGQPSQGLLWSGGACKLSEYHPESARRVMTMYFGINDAGTLVGHGSTDGGFSTGLVYRKGTFDRVDHGSGGFVVNWGINNAGDVVGLFNNSSGANHGFLLRNGRFTVIDFPGAPATTVYGLNNVGQVVGAYWTQGTMQGYVAQVTPAGPPSPVITVDDDGLDCPGSLRTIQEAVAAAPAGATILVCPGNYRGTVNITGPDKISLKLIAVGREDEVVLQGDNTERDGFHLENVSNVLVRGFTVRDFGVTATTAAVWGAGNQIYLENAHYNTIEQNHLINGDMVGIALIDSGNNIIQRNVAHVENSALANCGIHVQGMKSEKNMFRQNLVYGNKMAGIMLSNAGPGNILMDNTVINNGRDGITNTGTDGTWIEGNRVSYNRGPWGTSPYPVEARGVGRGITIGTSTGVTVFDNRGRSNTGVDLNWDGSGTNKFESNACDTATPAGGCGR